MVTKRKRVASGVDDSDLNKSWRVALGSPPAIGEDKVRLAERRTSRTDR